MLGHYVIGKPCAKGYGAIWRDDLYVPTGNTDRVYVESVSDTSPMFAHWQYGPNQAGYNSDCSCCYLGIAHSEQHHIGGLCRRVTGKVWGSFAGLVAVDVRPVEYGGYSEEYPVFPMWELWLAGAGCQSLYGVWDSEAGALSAAVTLRGKVTQ